MSEEPSIRITEADIEAIPKKDQGAGGQGAQVQWTDFQSPPVAIKSSVDVALVIDTSGSMGANDYAPNRLAAAIEAARMFTRRKVMQNYNDRVAVIGFGGSATVFHPLDSNLDNVAASLGKLSLTHSGTMVGTALRAAQRELQRGGGKRQAIVLLSDGGDQHDTSNPVQVAQGMAGIKIFTIGMGTVKGGMASLPHGQQRVLLNEDRLKQIAKVTGGEYLYAPDVPRLQEIYTHLADY